MKKGNKALKLLFTFILMILFMGHINADAITLEDIAEIFNENGYVNRLTDIYGEVEISAAVEEDEGEKVLAITSETENTSSTIYYNLNGNILHGEIFFDDYVAFEVLVDSIAQLNGYDEGDLFITLRSDEIANFQVNNEGIEINEVDYGNEIIAYDVKIDITKQIPIAHALLVEREDGGDLSYALKGEELEEPENLPIREISFNNEEYTIKAQPYEDYVFYKWLRDGDIYSYDEQITVKLDEDYHLTALFFPSDRYLLTVNTWQSGYIDIAEENEELSYDEKFSNAARNNAEIKTYKVGAKAEDGYRFVKWTLNGENYSTEPILNIKVDRNIDLVAVFKSVDDEVGEIEKKEITNNYGNATISNASNEIKDLLPLTMDELDALEDGANIYAFIEVSDISNTISEEDKKLIESKLDDNSKVGIYLDINLFKQIENQDKVKIEKTNGKVKISFEIPESLRNDNRTFYIVKLHNGVPTIIIPTRNNNILTFETDEFSTYVLSYTDEETTNITSNNPKTGDNIIISISLLIVSIIGLTTIGLNIKKKVNNN